MSIAIKEQNALTVSIDDIKISKLPIKQHPEYMGHEAVYRAHSPEHNVTCLIGIHNTALGPGLGGIRYKYYANEDEALKDVLRLSEAMTWKNAAGDLEFGGGKAVIMAPEDSTSPDKIALEVMAHAINQINSEHVLYHGAEDMNIGEDALNYMVTITPYINGATSTDPKIVGGSPSPLTAIGILECMKVAVRFKLGKDSLENIRVSLQGIGAVGGALAEMLHKEGAILTASDTTDAPFEALKAKGVAIEKVGLNEIYDVQADLFAANAVGGTLTEETVARLHNAGIKIVCGAANNQQQDQTGFTESKLMHELGMLYCPDYIVNAGGVIWVAKVGENAKEETESIRSGVPKRFKDVLDLHEQHPETDMATLAAQYSQMRVHKAKQGNN